MPFGRPPSGTLGAFFRRNDLKALTIRQPWVWAILHMNKRIENRTRRTNFRGRFYIHAGVAVPNWQPLEDVRSRCNEYPDPETLSYGVLVATAELVNCTWSDVIVGRWGEPNSWHWHLDNVKVLRQEIPVKGQLGLWEYRK